MNKHGPSISFVFVFWASLPSWILIYRKRFISFVCVIWTSLPSGILIYRKQSIDAQHMKCHANISLRFNHADRIEIADKVFGRTSDGLFCSRQYVIWHQLKQRNFNGGLLRQVSLSRRLSTWENKLDCCVGIVINISIAAFWKHHKAYHDLHRER